MTLIQFLDGVAVLVLLSLALLVGLALRRRVLSRAGGTFDCSLRLRPAGRGQGWALGIGRYAEDTLEWYRVFSLAARPRTVFARRSLEILERREPVGVEAFSLLADAVIVRCRHDNASVELGMSPDALTGFLSWLESAPPAQPA